MWRVSSGAIVIACCLSIAGSASNPRSFRDQMLEKGEVLCEGIAINYGGISGFPGTLDHHQMKYLRDGTTIPVVEFRNAGASDVRGVALVLEYSNANGDPVSRIPMVGSVAGGITVPFPSQELQIWDQQTKVGENVLLAPSFMGGMMRTCPVKATLSYARVVYSDGHFLTFEKPGWRVDALPKLIPEVPKELARNVPLPFTTTVQVSIDRTGKVTDVVEVPTELMPRENNSNAFRWAKSFLLDQWKFYPAVVDGNATESVLTYTVVAYSGAWTQIPEPEQDDEYLIRLVQKQDGSDRGGILVYYGENPEDTVFAAASPGITAQHR
ncbi:MAG TPA: hypothetical protein VKW78_22385 [Terriglobales bacterium]|nr:hypothetical protein [Terriglobales bacterium]